MKNNRAKRRAFQWKHLMQNRNFSSPYMLRNYRSSKRLRGNKFNIIRFKNVVNGLIDAAAPNNFPHSNKGDRAATMQKGAYLNYRDMTFSPCYQPGLSHRVNK